MEAPQPATQSVALASALSRITRTTAPPPGDHYLLARFHRIQQSRKLRLGSSQADAANDQMVN